MVLKLENGQILKIMPIIRKDGSHCFFIPVSCIFVDNKVIYDEDFYLNKLYNNYRDSNLRVNYTKKYLISVWHDNQFKMVSVGKSIHDIIIEELSKGSYDFRNNKHLKVVSLEVKTGFGQSFPDYKSSHFIDLDWEKPVESKEEWTDFIKNNQFEFDEFLKVKSVMYNLTFLNSKFDNFFSDLISDIRNKKNRRIGNMSVNPPNINFNNINLSKHDIKVTELIKRDNFKEEILINNIDELVNLLVDENYDIESKIKLIGYDVNNLIDVDDLDIVELIMQIEKDLDVNISDNFIEFNEFLKKVYSMIVSKRREKKLRDLGI